VLTKRSVFSRVLAPLLVLLAGCGGTAAPSAGPQNITASASGQPERSQLRAVYNTTAGAAVFLRIAAAQQLSQKYGITFDPQYAAPSGGVASLVSGETQLQLAAGPVPIQAIAGGAPLKMIASFGRTNGYAIVARSDISAPSDLKGKSIAIAARGDNTDISLRVALSRYGLQVDGDVSAVQVGGDGERLAALETGRVAATIVDEGAFGASAASRGMHIVMSLRQEKLPWVGVALVVTDSFRQENPKTVNAALKSLIDGVRFLADEKNRDQSIAIIAQDMKRDPSDPLVVGSYETYHKETGVFLPTDGVDIILEALRSMDAARYSGQTVDRFVDPSSLQGLQSSGFLTSLG
jgi:NitT/TauT family transport system substrate-binding protein